MKGPGDGAFFSTTLLDRYDNLEKELVEPPWDAGTVNGYFTNVDNITQYGLILVGQTSRSASKLAWMGSGTDANRES